MFTRANKSSAGIAVCHDNKNQCAAEGAIGPQVVPFVLAGVAPGPAGGRAGIDIPSVVPALIRASKNALTAGG